MAAALDYQGAIHGLVRNVTHNDPVIHEAIAPEEFGRLAAALALSIHPVPPAMVPALPPDNMFRPAAVSRSTFAHPFRPPPPSFPKPPHPPAPPATPPVIRALPLLTRAVRPDNPCSSTDSPDDGRLAPISEMYSFLPDIAYGATPELPEPEAEPDFTDCDTQSDDDRHSSRHHGRPFRAHRVSYVSNHETTSFEKQPQKNRLGLRKEIQILSRLLGGLSCPPPTPTHPPENHVIQRFGFLDTPSLFRFYPNFDTAVVRAGGRCGAKKRLQRE